MRYGIEVVPFGQYADPRAVVELAQTAESAGWEAIWLWDHLTFPYGCGDPFITLAAVAGATQRMKLITGVSPMPRYVPHSLARQLTSLDILSNGRVIFGAGLGADFDFTPFSGPDAKTRGQMTDEALHLLNGYWSGEPLTYTGKHYQTHNASLAPVPIQRPRIPIWIGGNSTAALRRAARWDGWIMGTVDESGGIIYTAQEVANSLARIQANRITDAPYDVAVDGVTPAGDTSIARAYQQVGATWWFECIYGSRGSHTEMLQRIHAGPPAL